MPTFSNRHEVAHKWAHRACEEGRTSHGNFYFEGPTIYSYGSHFPIARHVNGRFGRGVLFTTRTYSVTTGGHCSIVRRALHNTVPSANVFHVPDVTPESDRHRSNLVFLEKGILGLVLSIKQAREMKLGLLGDLDDTVEHANRYLDYFGIKRKPFEVPEHIDIKAEKKKAKLYRQRQEARWARNEEERKERKARVALEALESERKFRELVARWRAGANVELPQDRSWKCFLPDYTYDQKEEVFLRVKGSRIQTSGGAIVSIDEAEKLLALVRAGEHKKWGYHFNENREYVEAWGAPRIGDYTVTEVFANGDVQVSCHFLRKEEIERVAAILGLWEGDEPPLWAEGFMNLLDPTEKEKPFKEISARKRRTIRKLVLEEACT